MTTRAAAETEGGIGGTGEEASTVIVYYSDEAGQKIAHYFKKGS
jgi:hypothetical protein